MPMARKEKETSNPLNNHCYSIAIRYKTGKRKRRKRKKKKKREVDQITNDEEN